MAGRPSTAGVPSRADEGEIPTVSRRLSGVSVGGSKSADVEPAEDDSLLVVLPGKPSSPTLLDLEAAGDRLWDVLLLTGCTAGACKLNPDGTPARALGGARDEHYFAKPMDLGVLQPHVFKSAEAVLAPLLPGRRSSTSSCPALYNFLVAADALVPGPTGGRLRNAAGLKDFLSGKPSKSSVLFAADFRFRLGGGKWVQKEEWPGDQF